MEESCERLLVTLAMAVAHMRRLQKTTRKFRPHWDCAATLAAEKEVDDLVQLHLTPSPYKPEDPK